MNITFKINYNTEFGEELMLNIIKDRRGGAVKSVAYRMRTIDGKAWACNLKAEDNGQSHLDYYYTIVRGEQQLVQSEWTVEPHRIGLNVRTECVITTDDRWNATPEDAYLYTSAFTDCIRRRRLGIAPTTRAAVTLRLKVRAPQLNGKQRLVLVGSDRALGAWSVHNGVTMYEQNYNEWVADVDVAKLSLKTFEYKFVAVNMVDGGDVVWEDRMNRRMTLPQISYNEVLAVEEETALFPICNVKCAGTLVPLFSLRTAKSFGVGDFGDLRKMIDWVSMTGQRVLQLLPINDTTATNTWQDSYPYNCISIFALHPQYADLNALPPLADEQKRAEYEALRQELNALSKIDYERVNAAKTSYLRLLFVQEGKKVLASDAFKRFFAAAEQWLVPYAQYCSLRDEYGTADFSRWTGHENFNEDDRPQLTNPRTKAYKSVAFFYYVQFVLDAQMASAHSYARSKGVVLKGDIPIGVCRQGCDVWQEPRYFNMNGQAGAPPDDFSKNGQNWGFPTYNWAEMMKDGCRWWQCRFSNMARYFDAYRIDHVLGFFRIWEIPIHSVHGLLGQFSPSLGMTREEIEAYGLKFDERRFTEPYITDETLASRFGDEAEEVSKTYLDEVENGRYRMKSEYETQRKIEAAFVAKGDERDINLREGLYALVSDVLFVRDHRDASKFHPRISAQYDYSYKALNDGDKDLFNRIYNDYFYRRNNQYWYREAMEKLPRIIECSRMLACAEDLGMVPECVPWVMNELKILSLELQSMPKEYGVRFGVLSHYPYRSVCTISSHDTPTLRQWWDEDHGRTQDYYNNVLQKSGSAPHPLPGWLARDIIRRHLMCPSMLCILSLQDWLAVDEALRLADANAERVNIPANPRYYWRYRMHLNIDDMLANHGYSQNIRDLIEESGRA